MSYELRVEAKHVRSSRPEDSFSRALTRDTPPFASERVGHPVRAVTKRVGGLTG